MRPQVNPEQLRVMVEACERNRHPAQRLLNCENDSIIKCACGYDKKVTNFKLRNSGVVAYVDNVCYGCVDTHRDFSRLVCARCKVVAARLKPHKDQHGFVYKKDTTYHIDSCPACDPSLREEGKPAMIVEKSIFLRDKFGPGYTLSAWQTEKSSAKQELK